MNEMNIYHKELVITGWEQIEETISPMKIEVLREYRGILAKGWPHLNGKIEIGFIRGTNGKEICFSNQLSWEDEDWTSFVSEGIVQPEAINNCKMSGIDGFVFMVNHEMVEVSLNEI